MMVLMENNPETKEATMNADEWAEARAAEAEYQAERAADALREAHRLRRQEADEAADQERRIAAEARAVEEGHRAIRVDDDVTRYRVVSDSTDGAWDVKLTASARGEALSFRCDPAEAGMVGHGSMRGEMPCKHAALVARRLEREGLAAWSSGFLLTAKGAREVRRTSAALRRLPADPFEGLPS